MCFKENLCIIYAYIYFQNIPVESTPSENSMPKTVTQWSIFAMQKTIAVISSGSLDASTHNLLGIRPHIPPKSNDKDAGTSLSKNFIIYIKLSTIMYF